MDEQIRNALAGALQAEFENLQGLAPGSKEYQQVVENICKLYRLGLEDVKNDNEWNDICNRVETDTKQKEAEERLKRDQMAEQVKDRYFRLGTESAAILLPLIFYGIWMRRGFKFEETGTYTSTTFRGLFNRFRPTKK